MRLFNSFSKVALMFLNQNFLDFDFRVIRIEYSGEIYLQSSLQTLIKDVQQNHLLRIKSNKIIEDLPQKYPIPHKSSKFLHFQHYPHSNTPPVISTIPKFVILNKQQENSQETFSIHLSHYICKELCI